MSERMKTLGFDENAGSRVRSGDEVFVGAKDRAISENPRARATMPRRDLVEPIVVTSPHKTDSKCVAMLLFASTAWPPGQFVFMCVHPG